MINPKAKFTDSARYKCLENLEKRTVDLSLCYCGIEDCDPDHYYGPTDRTEYLLHYIMSGKGTYQVGGHTYHLGSHQLFLIWPGVKTYYVADHDDPWRYIWVAFNGIKAKTYLEWAHLSQDELVCEYDDADLLFHYVQELLNARELTYPNELKRQGILLLFLSALIESRHWQNSDRPVYDYSAQVYVDHALEFIEHNYMRGIRVSDIAQYIGINRSYLTSIFKKSLGSSVQEYLVNYRLDKAATLLRTTSEMIGNIAEEVGYADSLTFSKVFKSIKGKSPSEYRTSPEALEKASERHENNRLPPSPDSCN